MEREISKFKENNWGKKNRFENCLLLDCKIWGVDVNIM